MTFLFSAATPDDKLLEKNTTMVQMGIRVIQGPNSSSSNPLSRVPSTTGESVLNRIEECDPQKIKTSYNDNTSPDIEEAEGIKKIIYISFEKEKSENFLR